VTRFRSTIGLPGRHLHPQPAQPPHRRQPGIALSALDGLLMGAGDAVIGVNPATDTLPDYIRICEVLDAIRTPARHPHPALLPRPCHHRPRRDGGAARRSTWCSSPSRARQGQ
jgi:ethanolamine ammonia-lyase large subunit